MRTYVDGVLQSSIFDAGNYGQVSGDDIVHFLLDNSSEQPSGFLDYVRIYNCTPLIQEQVTYLYNGGDPTELPGTETVQMPVPTLNEWGVIILLLILACCAFCFIRLRKRVI